MRKRYLLASLFAISIVFMHALGPIVSAAVAPSLPTRDQVAQNERTYQYRQVMNWCVSSNSLHREDLRPTDAPTEWMKESDEWPYFDPDTTGNIPEDMYLIEPDNGKISCENVVTSALNNFGYGSDYSKFLTDMQYDCSSGTSCNFTVGQGGLGTQVGQFNRLMDSKKLGTSESDAMLLERRRANYSLGDCKIAAVAATDANKAAAQAGSAGNFSNGNRFFYVYDVAVSNTNSASVEPAVYEAKCDNAASMKAFSDLSKKVASAYVTSFNNYAKAVYKDAAINTICANTGTPTCFAQAASRFESCWAKESNPLTGTSGGGAPSTSSLASCVANGDKNLESRLLTAFSAAGSQLAQYGGSIAASSITSSADKGTNACGWINPDGALDVALSWITCPISGGMAQLAKWLGDRVADILFISPDDIFSPEFQKTWANFRNLGLGLIVISGLVMIASQGLGLDLLDAYTIRKLMPRLGVALVGIALSWPLMKLTLDITNTLGLITHDLIIGPFKTLGYPAHNGWSGLNAMLEWGFGLSGLAVGAMQAVFLGVGGVLALLGSFMLGILIGLLVLYVREIIVMTCIVFAPLAIASYVLPGTQKLWGFWKNTFITSLLMFPIIMAFLASGEALSRIAAATGDGRLKFTAVIVYFAPYFMLPFAFKMAGGLMSTIFSIANDKSRGVFDRSRKFRQEAKAYRRGEFASEGKTMRGPLGKLVGGYAGRTALARQGGFSLTGDGQRRYQQARKRLRDDMSKKSAEEGMHHVGGDTDATIIGAQATSKDDFRKLYRDRKESSGFIDEYVSRARANGSTASKTELEQEAEEHIAAEAEEKMARLEGGFQKDIGSKAMRRAAMLAMVTGDNGAWDGVAGAKKAGETNEDYALRSQQAKEKVIQKQFQDGIFGVDDYAAIERASKTRPDNIFGSFGEHVDYYQKVKAGTVGVDERKGANSNMYKETAATGQTSANRRSVKKIASQMKERLVASSSGNKNAYGEYIKEDGKRISNLMGDGSIDTWAAEYAAGADIHEAQTYSGNGNTEYYADVWKEQAFSQADVAAMGDAKIKAEAQKLIDAATAAGQIVTHQDVKNHLQGNAVVFSDAAGKITPAEPASPEALKAFSARKKEWGNPHQVPVNPANQKPVNGGGP